MKCPTCGTDGKAVTTLFMQAAIEVQGADWWAAQPVDTIAHGLRLVDKNVVVDFDCEYNEQYLVFSVDGNDANSQSYWKLTGWANSYGAEHWNATPHRVEGKTETITVWE